MAPIVIFAYNRPDHTQRLLVSLLHNPEAADAELYIFIDGTKRDSDREKVHAVKQLAQQVEGFKAVHITAQPTNKGLAASVIDGVSLVLQEHPEVIVLEDDLIVSDDFLHFMNEALDTFRHRRDIWSISGYTPALAIPQDYRHDTFLVPRPQCWGWATWQDRWVTIDWEVKEFARMQDREQRNLFNRGGNDLYRTLDMERHSRIESWAVRWCYAAFLQQAYTLNPVVSKVKNSGMADSDSHAGWHDQRHDVKLSTKPILLEPDLQPDATMMALFKQHHDLGLVSRIGYFMRRHGLGYHFAKKHILPS